MLRISINLFIAKLITFIQLKCMANKVKIWLVLEQAIIWLVQMYENKKKMYKPGFVFKTVY